MSIYRRVFGTYLPFWKPTVLAMLLTLASTAFNLLRVWPFPFLVDHVLRQDGPHRTIILGRDYSATPIPVLVLALCGLIVLFHLLGSLLNLWTTLIFVRVGLQSLLQLRTRLYAYLHSLPLKFHDQRRTADSSFRVAYDSQAIQSIYAKGTFIFQSVIGLALTFMLMWRLDRELSLLSLAVVPVMMLTMYVYANRIRAHSTTIQESESALLTVAQEGLSSVRMVQAFGREEYEVQLFQHDRARQPRGQSPADGRDHEKLAGGRHHHGREHGRHLLLRLAARARRHALAGQSHPDLELPADALLAAGGAHESRLGAGRLRRCRAALF